MQLLPAHPNLRPQQRGEQEAGRDRLALPHAGIGAGQCLGDEGFVGLEEGIQQRQDAVVQPFVTQPLQAGQAMAAFQQFHHLVEQPCWRHVLQQRSQRADGLERGRIDLEIQLGGKAHGAQHPHRILAVAGGGVTDHAQQPGRQIVHPAHRIDQRLGNRVVIEGVDGEIASVGVFFAGAEHVVVQHPPMGVGLAIGMGCAEGGDLDGLAPEHHVNDAKAPADDACASKERLHRLGGGVGGYVEVFRGAA